MSKPQQLIEHLGCLRQKILDHNHNCLISIPSTICRFILRVCVSMRLCVCASVCFCVRMSMVLFFHKTIDLFIYVSIYPFTYKVAHTCIYLSMCLYLHFPLYTQADESNQTISLPQSTEHCALTHRQVMPPARIRCSVKQTSRHATQVCTVSEHAYATMQ